MAEVKGGITTPNLRLLQDIKRLSGENVNLCFQCQKCASGCPVAYAMDYTPTQLIHAIRLGREDIVFNSKTVWLCASCETCTTRCPQGLDIAKVMDTVKILMQKRKLPAPVPSVVTFYQSALNNIKIFGRLYELGLIMDMKLRTKQYMKDVELGMKMFKKGKIKILPDFDITRMLATIRLFKYIEKRETKL
jgi:heterodisulfide reductase subunit C